MNKEILVLLNKSFDLPLTEEEEKKLVKALEESQELQHEKQRIEKMRKQISESAVTSFSTHFSNRVMSIIDSINSSVSQFELMNEWFTFIFRRIAFAGTIIAILLILINFIGTNQISLIAAFGIPEITIAEVFEPVFTFNTGLIL